MTAKEQWQAWRGAEAPANVGVEDFIRWIGQFTSEEEDSDGLFARWRDFPDHDGILRRVLEGEIVGVGTGPQLLFGLFFGLYQILQGRKCFVATSEPVDIVYGREVIRRFVTYLGRIVIRVHGSMLATDKLYLGNCGDVNLVLCDYIELMSLMKKNEELFRRHVQSLFLLEFDLPVYTMRLVMLDHGIERGGGMVYHNTGKTPEEWEKGFCLDTSKVLRSLDGIPFGGTYSYLNSYTASELESLLGPMLKKKIKLVNGKGNVSYTYRKDSERASMLVRDVMQTEGNAVVICYTDGVRQAICEEFRKSGQEVTQSINAMDILTAFAQTSTTSAKKKVMIMRSVPSTMIIPQKPLCKGAVFLAEHFLSTNIEEKAKVISEAVFENAPAVRVYFSLEDQLFTAYEEKAGFEKLFKLIDFTEKYDPWRQIRRVLAKTMEKRLHKHRLVDMDESQPMITMLIQGGKSASLQGNERPHLTSKLDAPCFCGSGKPFRECHGKKK